MRLNHMHVEVRNLPEAIAWLSKVWQVEPSFQNERIAVFPFGSFSLILDASDQNSPATVGFESEDCDLDYKRVIQNGGVALEGPSDRLWGPRTAYIKGPAALKFEIEQPLG